MKHLEVPLAFRIGHHSLLVGIGVSLILQFLHQYGKIQFDAPWLLQADGVMAFIWMAIGIAEYGVSRWRQLISPVSSSLTQPNVTPDSSSSLEE